MDICASSYIFDSIYKTTRFSDLAPCTASREIRWLKIDHLALIFDSKTQQIHTGQLLVVMHAAMVYAHCIQQADVVASQGMKVACS